MYINGSYQYVFIPICFHPSFTYSVSFDLLMSSLIAISESYFMFKGFTPFIYYIGNTEYLNFRDISGLKTVFTLDIDTKY